MAPKKNRIGQKLPVDALFLGGRSQRTALSFMKIRFTVSVQSTLDRVT
jgi:hypothetical protein